METPEWVTQHTPIRDADRLLSIEAVVVQATDDLQRVTEVAVEHPGARTISVVDDDGKPVGIIPVRVLANKIFFKIVPEQFLGHDDHRRFRQCDPRRSGRTRRPTYHVLGAPQIQPVRHAGEHGNSHDRRLVALSAVAGIWNSVGTGGRV